MALRMKLASGLPPVRIRAAAFTLTELLIAVGLGVLFFTGLGLFSAYSGRSFWAMENYADLNTENREALDQMIREIRHGARVTQYRTNRITLQFNTESSTAYLVEYAWDPDARQLLRTSQGETKVLLNGCDFLRFEMYQRTPYPGATNVFYATTNPDQCKLINIRWRTARRILGKTQTNNTESVQTAQVVLRNKVTD